MALKKSESVLAIIRLKLYSQRVPASVWAWTFKKDIIEMYNCTIQTEWRLQGRLKMVPTLESIVKRQRWHQQSRAV